MKMDKLDQKTLEIAAILTAGRFAGGHEPERTPKEILDYLEEMYGELRLWDLDDKRIDELAVARQIQNWRPSDSTKEQ